MIMKIYSTVWYMPWNYIRQWWFMRSFKTSIILTVDKLEPNKSIILQGKQ